MYAFATLKARHREVRDALPKNLSLRIHRALSWLNCAEQHEEDLDSKFIFLWISFNAAYAHEMPNRWETPERQLLQDFLEVIIRADSRNIIRDIVWNDYPSSIRLLIDNRYLYQQFWDFHNRLIQDSDWQSIFGNAKIAAHKALGRQDTNKVLAIVFERLYILRNQLVHGGATWGGAVNRSQIRDATNLMGRIVPALIGIMLNDKPELTGKPCFLVVE